MWQKKSILKGSPFIVFSFMVMQVVLLFLGSPPHPLTAAPALPYFSISDLPSSASQDIKVFTLIKDVS